MIRSASLWLWIWGMALSVGADSREAASWWRQGRSVLYWEVGDERSNEFDAWDVTQFRLAALEIRELNDDRASGVYTEIYGPPDSWDRSAGRFEAFYDAGGILLVLDPDAGPALRFRSVAQLPSLHGPLFKGGIDEALDSQGPYFRSFYWYPELEPEVAAAVFPGLRFPGRPDEFSNRRRPVERFTEPVSIDRFTVEHGLHHDTVRTIAQSMDDHMWFGSFEGLLRFDGQEFKAFFPDLNIRSVVCGGEEAPGRLAFLTAEGAVYDLQRPFSGVEAPTLVLGDYGVEEGFRDLAIDSEGGLWALADEAVFSLREERAYTFRPLDPTPAFLKDSQDARQLTPLGSGRFLVVGFGGAQELRIRPSGACELVQWSPTPAFMRTVDSRKGPLGDIDLVTSHPLGVVTDAGTRAWRWFETPPTTFVCWASDGGVWGSHRNEIWKLGSMATRATLDRYPVTERGHVVKDVFEARDGSVWFIVQNEGVGRLQTIREIDYLRPPFEGEGAPPGDTYAPGRMTRTYGVATQGNGVQWVAGGAGILRRDGDQREVHYLGDQYTGLAAHLVVEGRGARDGELWFALDTHAGFGDYLRRLPPKDQARLPVLGRVDSRGELQIMRRRGEVPFFERAHALVDAGERGLLLSTDSGLYRGDAARFERLSPHPTQGMALETGNTVWAAMRLGPGRSAVVRLDPDTGALLASFPDPKLVHENASASNESRAVTVDGSGFVWVAGERGFRVLAFDEEVNGWSPLGDGGWIVPPVFPAESQDWDWLHSGVAQVQAVGDLLCFITSQGLFVAEKQAVVEAVEAGRHNFDYYRFDRDDGIDSSLTGQGFWPLAHAVPGDRLLISLGRAVAELSPRALVSGVQAPRPVLRGLGYLDSRGNRVALDEQAVVEGVYQLPPGAGRSVFANFSAVAFGAQERLQFAWALDGLRSSMDFSSESSASFFSLPSGPHQLEIWGRNHNGVLSEEPLRIRFRIAARPQETTAFYVLIGGLTLVGGFACGRAVMAVDMRRRALERQRIFDEERSRISRDIHDEVGTALAQIRMLAGSQLGSERVDSSHPWERRRHRISELAYMASQTVRDVIWTFNPDKAQFEHLAEYLFSYAESAFTGSEVRLEFKEDRQGSRGEDYPSKLKYELLLMTKGIVSNVLRHAEATRFWMRVGRSEDGGLTIEFGDDGRGFDPGAVSGSDGISGLIRRAEAMGATLRLESRPGEGARYYLSVGRAALKMDSKADTESSG